MSVKRYDFDGNADGYFDDPFMKVREKGKFVLHSEYAALEARHDALREAVAWERECREVLNWLRTFRDWPELTEAGCSHRAARAEVDRLLSEEES